MKYQGLKNFGQFHIPKKTSQVQAQAATILSSELGILKFPKYMAKALTKDRHWKGHKFQAAEERGITNEEFLSGIASNVAAYTALQQVCGKSRCTQIYNRIIEKTGLAEWENWIPSARDFMDCADPWEALRHYFIEYFQANEREGVFNLEIVENSASMLRLNVTDCAWHALYTEAGCPELPTITKQAEVLFLSRFFQSMGGDFQRPSWLCRGEGHCDWQFLRYKPEDSPVLEPDRFQTFSLD